MKKILLALLLFAGVNTFGQSWAAPGATWYYDFAGGFGPGYERITRIGDTTINSNQYDVLESFLYWHNNFTGTDDSAHFSHHYTRIVSNVVYYYYLIDSTEYVLYDFNAVAGDSWLSRSQFYMQMPCDTGTIVVDSVSTISINSTTLKVLYNSPATAQNPLQFFGRIIEKIGGMAHLLPYPSCIADLPQGYNFRCYSDSSGWNYQSPMMSNSCNYITSANTIDQQTSLSLYPVPAELELFYRINTSQRILRISIIDITGKEISVIKNSAREGRIGTSMLSSGIYLLQVQTENGMSHSRFTVK